MTYNKWVCVLLIVLGLNGTIVHAAGVELSNQVEDVGQSEAADKKQVDSILKSIVKILRLKNVGLSKASVVESLTLKLIKTHKGYSVGSSQRKEHLALLKTEIEKTLSQVASLPKERRPTRAEVDAAFQGTTEFEPIYGTSDERVRWWLEKYFHKTRVGTVDSSGVEVIAGYFAGGGVGLGAGTFTDQFGRKYWVVCPQLDGAVGGIGYAGGYHVSQKVEGFAGTRDSLVFGLGVGWEELGTTYEGQSNFGGGLGLGVAAVIHGELYLRVVRSPFEPYDYAYMRKALGILYRSDEVAKRPFDEG